MHGVEVLKRIFKNFNGTGLDSFISTGRRGFRVYVVFVSQVAGEISRAEFLKVIVIERLDTLHVSIVHLFGAVNGNPFKAHCPGASAVVNAYLGDDFVGRGDDVMFFGSELGLRGDFGIEQPEGNVHGLNRLNAVVRREVTRQEQMPLVKLLEGGNGVGFGLLERDNVIGLQHAIEPLRNHRWVAAIDALSRHGVFVADKLGTATRTRERMKSLSLVARPLGAGVLGCPLSLLSLRRTCCKFLLALEEFFNRGDFKLRAAVFASHSLLAGHKTKRRAAVRAFITDR